MSPPSLITLPLLLLKPGSRAGLSGSTNLWKVPILLFLMLVAPVPASDVVTTVPTVGIGGPRSVEAESVTHVPTERTSPNIAMFFKFDYLNKYRSKDIFERAATMNLRGPHRKENLYEEPRKHERSKAYSGAIPNYVFPGYESITDLLLQLRHLLWVYITKHSRPVCHHDMASKRPF